MRLIRDCPKPTDNQHSPPLRRPERPFRSRFAASSVRPTRLAKTLEVLERCRKGSPAVELKRPTIRRFIACALAWPKKNGNSNLYSADDSRATTSRCAIKSAEGTSRGNVTHPQRHCEETRQVLEALQVTCKISFFVRASRSCSSSDNHPTCCRGRHQGLHDVIYPY